MNDLLTLIYKGENESLEFITNRSYREINKVSDETSRKELVDIVEKGLLSITGKGRGVKYVPTLGA